MRKIKKGLSLLKEIIFNKTFGTRVAYFILKKFAKVTENQILYESYHGKNMTGNLYAMYLSISHDERFKGYMHIWVLDDINVVSEYENTLFIKRNSFKYALYLLSSKYLISNTSFLPFVNKQKNQIYINTWHGTPLKMLGDDIQNSYGSGKNITRNLLQTDFLISPNKYTTDKLLRSHNIETLYPGKIIENGYPRTDLLFQNEADKDKLKRELHLPDNKNVILYAPTYRGNYSDPQNEQKIVEQVLGILALKFDGFVILYKGHYFKNFTLDNSTIFNISNSIDTNELLSIVDVLITDYSSIAFDYLVLNKPILYFVYDLEKYSQDRGLYFDIYEMPGTVCKTTSEVVDTIENIDIFMTKYKVEYSDVIAKICKYDNGNVTQKIINAIFFNDKEEVNIYKLPKNKKIKILLYGGSFLNNGITSSLAGLLSNISYDIYEVYLITNTDVKGERFKRIAQRIPNNVKIIYIPQPILIIFQSLYKFMTPKQLERIFTEENYSYLGNAQFDIAIDYSGYESYWASMIAYTNAKKKYIYLHSDMKAESIKRSHILEMEYLYDLYKNRFDKLITVSSSSYNANRSSLPEFIDKIEVVHNPIDAVQIKILSNYNEPYSEIVDNSITNFINIGRYSIEKGQDRLIEAFATLYKNHKNIHLYLVGHGPLHSKLEILIDKLKMNDHITLTGNMENPFPLLKKCDCFVLSSHYEGQGLVLMEALILDVPIISTDIPGPQSILSSDQGLLVKDCIEGLKFGMEQFLKGNIPFKQFDHKKYITDSMDEFYKTII